MATVVFLNTYIDNPLYVKRIKKDPEREILIKGVLSLGRKMRIYFKRVVTLILEDFLKL